MDIRGEIAYGGRDTLVECAAEGEVPAYCVGLHVSGISFLVQTRAILKKAIYPFALLRLFNGYCPSGCWNTQLPQEEEEDVCSRVDISSENWSNREKEERLQVGEKAIQIERHTKTHPRRTHPSITRLQRQQRGNSYFSIFVVGADFLSHLYH